MGHKNYKSILAPKDYPGNKDYHNYCYEHHYIFWKNTGRLIKKNEVIHHKDENKRNNNFKNLELLTKSSHCKHHHKVKPMIELKCKYCKNKFKRKRNVFKYTRKNNKLGLFCSVSCGAKYQHNKQ